MNNIVYKKYLYQKLTFGSISKIFRNKIVRTKLIVFTSRPLIEKLSYDNICELCLCKYVKSSSIRISLKQKVL